MPSRPPPLQARVPPGDCRHRHLHQRSLAAATAQCAPHALRVTSARTTKGAPEPRTPSSVSCALCPPSRPPHRLRVFHAFATSPSGPCQNDHPPTRPGIESPPQLAIPSPTSVPTPAYCSPARAVALSTWSESLSPRDHCGEHRHPRRRSHRHRDSRQASRGGCRTPSRQKKSELPSPMSSPHLTTTGDALPAHSDHLIPCSEVRGPSAGLPGGEGQGPPGGAVPPG